MSGPDPVAIREVQSRGDIDLFHAAGLAARAGDPAWVPSLRHELHVVLDPVRSPVMAENDVALFVAERQGRPVGRISAVVNRAHLARHGGATGHFGLLEAPDDDAVFDALVEACSRWLAARGMTRIAGPFSLSINHEAGLLVHGFDEPHFVRTNHAPPFYSRHLERLGFRKAMDLLAYSCRVSESDYPERVARVLAGARGARTLHTRGLSALRWMRDSEKLNTLFNDAWSENWGAVPVSAAEAALIARLSRAAVKPSWLRLAEQDGEPIAIVGQVPDMNEVLPRDGALLPFGWARLLYGLHVRGTRRSRIALIGVASRWRGTRLGSLAISRLMAEAIDQARRAGIEEIEISWMLETNRAVLNLVASLPARHTRTFRIYERELVSP